ncbi:MAG: MBL fold metallo-hydrolase, partial [bacterium]
GYIFDFNGILAYCTGDMNVGLDNYIHKMTRVKGLRPDILLICINPGFGNFGPWEAARFTKFVEPRMVIPMHYNLIEENTVDPQLFLNALVQQQVEAIPVVMGYGGKYIYRKG